MNTPSPCPTPQAGSALGRRHLLRSAGITVAGIASAGLPRLGGFAHAATIPDAARPEAPTPPSFAARSITVTDFGATPDDGGDDTIAIQQAIDTVAADGGGTVYLEPGRYDLSIQPTGVAITLRTGVRLAARTAGATTLRIADAQGDYYAILATFAWEQGTGLPRNAEVHDIGVDGLHFDMNAAGNPIHEEGRPFGPPNHQRAALWANMVSRLSVLNCSFDDSYSIQVILINQPGVSTDITVEHCTFSNVGGSSQNYDHSTIYTSGARARVAYCTFDSRNGAGTNGARTAVELHGEDQTCVQNNVRGYTNGFNTVGGYRFHHGRRHLIQHNTFTEMLAGGLVWHKYLSEDEQQGSTMTDVIIDRNSFSMNVGGWLGLSVHKPRAGILTQPNDGSPIERLQITGNRFDFGDVAPLAHDPEFIEDTLSAGISLWAFQNPTFAVREFVIENNLIINPISAGVFSNTPLSSGRIVNNTVLNPGSNGTFDPPKDYDAWGYPPYTDEMRTAVYLDAALTDVEVDRNRSRCAGRQCYR